MIDPCLLIEELLKYSELHLDLDSRNEIYFRNYLIHEFSLKDFHHSLVDNLKIAEMNVPDELINQMISYFKEQGLNDQEIEEKCTAIMGTLSPLPSEVYNTFTTLYDISPKEATDYLYQLSLKNDYVKKSKIDQNIIWYAAFKNITLEITINLTKPEKDNKDIKKALETKKSNETNYPECMICIDNEGCYGSKKTPPRGNLRLIPLKLGNKMWYLQYSPYGYFNEHCILIDETHQRMEVSLENLTSQVLFVEKFPHYFLGSNADLPIVGGSILTHEHFQGGRHRLPLMKASKRLEFDVKNYEDVSLALLDWPSAALVVESSNKDHLIEVGYKIIEKWKHYDNLEINILSKTLDEEHNTATTIVEKVDEKFRLFIILRNNRTDATHEDGIFHVRKDRQFVKKEGIGLIEAMGLFVLPARLKRQISLVNEAIKDPKSLKKFYKVHQDMIPFSTMIDDLLKKKYQSAESYISVICYKILEDISVFKNDTKGQEALKEFIESVGL